MQTAFLGQAKLTTCITMSGMCVCVFLGVAVLDFAVSLSSGSDETLCHRHSPELKSHIRVGDALEDVTLNMKHHSVIRQS